MKTVRRCEASRRVMEEHSNDLKVWREQFRTTAGSRTRKAVPPPEMLSDFLDFLEDLEEEVMRGKLFRE